MPTAVERIIWGFGDGSTLAVFDTPGGKMGAVICWGNYMPLLRAAMYTKGIQIYCAPTADDRETWITTMRYIALEGPPILFTQARIKHVETSGGLTSTNRAGWQLAFTNVPVCFESGFGS